MNKQIRLFFALWPDDATRKKIILSTESIQLNKEASKTSVNNLHLTLLFMGNVEVEKLPCFKQQAGRIKCDSFTLGLNKISSFKKAKVIWLGGDVVPGELVQLQSAVSQAVEKCGLVAETRSFKPHITLARKASIPDLPKPATPFNWKINSFSLISSEQSTTGVIYKELIKYSLL